jgi:hypothetical protein
MPTDMVRWAAALLLSVGCNAASTTKSAGSPPAVLVFEESCDGSAAALLTPQRLLVGNDEDNLLRVYDAQRGGPPLERFDLGVFLAPGGGESAKEADLEGAAVLADRVYWIGSHGLNASGKVRVERRSLLATRGGVDGQSLELVGAPFSGLLPALFSDARYAAFRLQEASARVPKESGGLNVEALAARREGGLWIGFRSPVHDGKALLAVLLNPEEVVQGGRARLGEPQQLGLAGLGIRDLARFRGGYLLIAGGSQSSEPSRLYRWDGGAAARALPSRQLAGLNGEALVVSADHSRVLVLSDDGTRERAGIQCKNSKHSADKSFRGIWMSVGSDW